MPDTSFGTLLRQLREEKGYTLEELAEMSGLTHVGIGDWERGKRNPRKSNIYAVAKALGITPSGLLLAAGFAPDSGDGEIEYVADDDREFLLDTYDQLGKDSRDTLKLVAERMLIAERNITIGGKRDEKETGEEKAPAR